MSDGTNSLTVSPREPPLEAHEVKEINLMQTNSDPTYDSNSVTTETNNNVNNSKMVTLHKPTIP